MNKKNIVLLCLSVLLAGCTLPGAEKTPVVEYQEPQITGESEETEEELLKELNSIQVGESWDKLVVDD